MNEEDRRMLAESAALLEWLCINVLGAGYTQGDNGRVVSDSLITEGHARALALLARLRRAEMLCEDGA